MKFINYLLLATLASQPLLHADENLFSSVTGWISRNASTLAICSGFTALNWYLSKKTSTKAAEEVFSARAQVTRTEFLESTYFAKTWELLRSKDPNHLPKNKTPLGILSEYSYENQLMQEEKFANLETKVTVLRKQMDIVAGHVFANDTDHNESPKQSPVISRSPSFDHEQSYSGINRHMESLVQSSKNCRAVSTPFTEISKKGLLEMGTDIIQSKCYYNRIFLNAHKFAEINPNVLDMLKIANDFTRIPNNKQ